MSIRFDAAASGRLATQTHKPAHKAKPAAVPVPLPAQRPTAGGAARPIGFQPGPNPMLPPVGLKGGANNM